MGNKESTVFASFARKSPACIISVHMSQSSVSGKKKKLVDEVTTLRRHRTQSAMGAGFPHLSKHLRTCTRWLDDGCVVGCKHFSHFCTAVKVLIQLHRSMPTAIQCGPPWRAIDYQSCLHLFRASVHSPKVASQSANTVAVLKVILWRPYNVSSALSSVLEERLEEGEDKGDREDERDANHSDDEKGWDELLIEEEDDDDSIDVDSDSA
jgi:hypothetical protein